MVKLRDPLSQVLDEVEETEADVYVPLELDGLMLLSNYKKAEKIRARKITRRRKK